MRQSRSTLRRPTVNRNRKPSLFAGLLDESGPQRMIATAKATSWPAVTESSWMSKARSGLMIAEEQVPGPFVRLDPLALEGRRQVEHHDILIMMGKNARKVMPADSISPPFDERFDLCLGRFAWLRHRFHLECLLTNVGVHIRHAMLQNEWVGQPLVNLPAGVAEQLRDHSPCSLMMSPAARPASNALISFAAIA
jgi:hypothetical protein